MAPPNLPFEPATPAPAPQGSAPLPPPPMPAPAPAPRPLPPPTRPPAIAKEPEDIFTDIERPTMAKPAMSSAPMMAPSGGAHFSPAKVFAVVIAILIVISAVAFAFWWLVIRMPAVTPTTTLTPVAPAPIAPTTPTPPPVSNEPLNVGSDLNSDTSTANETTSTSFTSPAPVTEPPAGSQVPPPTSIDSQPPTTATSAEVDTDHDGLSDRRETELGLDPNNPDSDGDRLSDGDEVIKFGTNPLNSDTDRDTYKDGDEVANGYNPRGDGKCAQTDCSI